MASTSLSRHSARLGPARPQPISSWHNYPLIHQSPPPSLVSPTALTDRQPCFRHLKFQNTYYTEPTNGPQYLPPVAATRSPQLSTARSDLVSSYPLCSARLGICVSKMDVQTTSSGPSDTAAVLPQPWICRRCPKADAWFERVLATRGAQGDGSGECV